MRAEGRQRWSWRSTRDGGGDAIDGDSVARAEAHASDGDGAAEGREGGGRDGVGVENAGLVGEVGAAVAALVGDSERGVTGVGWFGWREWSCGRRGVEGPVSRRWWGGFRWRRSAFQMPMTGMVLAEVGRTGELS